MKEKLNLSSEKSESLPSVEISERKEALKHAMDKKAESSKNSHAENLKHIRTRIESEAKSKKEHEHNKEKEKPAIEKPVLINKELKDIAYRRTLKRTQNKLPAPARAFSKIIHQPAVEAVSEITAKTIARPSGILAGGIFAFLGSSLFLWVSKHYGYEYNFLLSALFFAGGFFLGLLIELILRSIKRSS